MRGEVENQVDELLREGIIRPFKSPYNSPIWVVQNEVAPQSKPLTPARTEYKIKEIARLPDCVKELQVFECEAGGYDPWTGRAEAILKDYEVIKERPLYRSKVVSIRQKIMGNAETTLLSYNVAEDDWPETKRVLMRDLPTLEYQMGQMTQGRRLWKHFTRE